MTTNSKKIIRGLAALSLVWILGGCVKAPGTGPASADTSLSGGNAHLPPVVILDSHGKRVTDDSLPSGHDHLTSREGLSDLPPFVYQAPATRDTRAFLGGTGQDPVQQ